MENKKQLEILVVEDKPINQRSISQLKEEGHNVDIAETFAEAVEYLGNESKEGKKYDVVLTDMMLPLGEGIVNLSRQGERERYQENALGYAVALHSARKGVPMVAVVTDMNHHAGPISATFDLFYTEEGGRPIMTVNDSRLMMFDERDLTRLYVLKDGNMTEDRPDYDAPEEEKEKYVKDEEGHYQTTKNWKAALTKLITGDETSPY